MKLSPIFFVIGILLTILSGTMLIPALVDLHAGNEDWKVFALSMLCTGFFGVLLILVTRERNFEIGVRQAFLLTTLSWTLLAVFGALPMIFSQLNMSITDAIFESTSGITTTGSTVIVGLDNAPPGLLLWRAILQWLGGIGIIVMALSVLPFLNVGGMQLFRTESSESEKAMPRTAQLAGAIAIVYVGLTFVCMVCYMLTGLELFDAVAHAMTTIATGGYSTRDASMGYFDNPMAEMVAIAFMIIGSLPFVLYLRVMRFDWRALFSDSQVRWFLTILSLSIVIMAAYKVSFSGDSAGQALRYSAFNVVSVITGTGYGTTDFSLWGPFAVGTLFFLMCVGGCAGSTTCGIKIFRIQVLYEVTKAQIMQLLHPHGVFLPTYNGKPLPQGVPISVMSFFFLFALSFTLLAICLHLIGLDFLTAMSGAATSISNVGPGLGPIIGPGGTFAPLPDTAKWVLCVGMLLGRLELFTVMVLLAPKFWRS